MRDAGLGSAQPSGGMKPYLKNNLAGVDLLIPLIVGFGPNLPAVGDDHLEDARAVGNGTRRSGFLGTSCEQNRREQSKETRGRAFHGGPQRRTANGLE